MPNLNKVLLMGHLTRDPQQRFTPSGQSLVTFGLAVNRRYKVGDEKREDRVFVDVESWGPVGELIAKHVGKGDPLFVEGRLRMDEWESKEGSRRSKLVVVLESFQFLGGRKGR